MKHRSTFFAFPAMALALVASVALTGCGNDRNEPLTEAQMQRRQQEQVLQAERDRQSLARQQQDLALQQQRADLERQRLENQAYQQQMLPPQERYVQQAPTTPPPQVDSGIGAGTALLGAAAAGAAGYALGKTTSQPQKQYYNAPPANNTYRQQAKPAPKYTSTYKAPAPKPTTYKAPPAPKRAAAPVKFSSTKR